MENKRPQLNVEELHQLKWLLGGVLVLLSVWTVFYLEFDAWTLMGLATVGVIATMARPGWPAYVPPWMHRLAFPAIVAFFLGDLWWKGEVLPAIVRLDILLLWYRGVTYRKKRDDLQVVVLGLFLIVVAGVLTVSLIFAAQILVFSACALAFLLVITLLEAAETQRPTVATRGAPAWVQVRWGRLFARVRDVTDWRIVVLSGALFVGVVGLSALLFLAIPRFQLENSLFLERFTSKKGRSGFNETIRFGEVTEIMQDNSLALTVDVSDHAQVPSTPYWRMLVLDDYHEGAFRLSAAQGKGRDQTHVIVNGTARGRAKGTGTWTFYLESGISRFLPLLGDFDELRFQERQNFHAYRALGLVALREEPVTMTAYRVEGMFAGEPQPDLAFLKILNEPKGPDAAVAAAQMLRLLQGEADCATLRRVANEITRGATMSAGEFMRAANRWLGERHGYSLTPQIPAGPGDALVRWLTSHESGHCELFAGSFVMIARAAGFSTRVVTGFKGGTWNAYSNNFTVRNSDAHAWCEIFDRDAGVWLVADPTLSAGNVALPDDVRGDVALARRTDRSWNARLESLRVFWYRRIVNFDQDVQVEALKAMKEATQNSSYELRLLLSDLMKRIVVWLRSPWDAARVMKMILAIGVFAGAVLGWRRFGPGWWREMRGRSGEQRGDPVRAEAGKWLRRIADYGSRMADRGVPVAGREAVKGDLERLRFGRRTTWQDPERVFRRAQAVWREMRKEIRRGRRAGDRMSPRA
ncbi:MAG: transglutaminase domain protein [Verrucomicrobia bacterium]|nr:transglutaminase domain protein [Verrucomicrobiota bacterium]